jgi:hypothetical protein
MTGNGEDLVVTIDRLRGRAFFWHTTLHCTLTGHSGDPWWTPRDQPGAYIGEFDPSHLEGIFGFVCQRRATIADVLTWLDYGLPDEVAMRPPMSLADLLGTPFMQAAAALLIGAGRARTVAHWEALAYGPPPPRRVGGDLWD